MMLPCFECTIVALKSADDLDLSELAEGAVLIDDGDLKRTAPDLFLPVLDTDKLTLHDDAIFVEDRVCGQIICNIIINTDDVCAIEIHAPNLTVVPFCDGRLSLHTAYGDGDRSDTNALAIIEIDIQSNNIMEL